MPAPIVRRRPVRRAAMAAALAAAVAVAGAGCSSTAPDSDEITEALVASGLPDDVAACAADALTETLTDEQLEQLTERGGGGAPVDDPARTDDTADQLRDAMSACRTILESSTTTTTTTPAEGATTTTVAPDDGSAGGGATGGGESIDSTPTSAP